MNAFSTNINVQQQQIQWITLEDHQKALNDLSNEFRHKINKMNQSYVLLSNEYKSKLELLQQKQNELKMVQTHCVKIESSLTYLTKKHNKLTDITKKHNKLTYITKKYNKLTDIIPEKIYHNIRGSLLGTKLSRSFCGDQ